MAMILLTARCNLASGWIIASLEATRPPPIAAVLILGENWGVSEQRLSVGNCGLVLFPGPAATATWWGVTRYRAVRGLALLTTGILVYAQGKNAAAAPFFDESIALLRDADDLNLLAHAVTMRGYVSLGTGEHTLMAESFEQALAMHRQLGDRWGEGVTLNGRGYAALFEDHPDEGWRLLVEAEEALREADSPADLAANRNMLAMIAYWRGSMR